MKIICPICNASGVRTLVNEYHSAAVHTRAYHELIIKIREKIESLENEAKDGIVADYRHGYSDQAELLKSLLGDEEEKIEYG